MIGIIDYRMGNLRSVQKALQRVGAPAEILRTADQVSRCDKLILPGVGAFADGMTHLRDGRWVQAIHDFLQAGKPFLGICLGMQLLFSGSEEDAASPDQLVPGLGILPGAVRRFRGPAYGAGKLKVPHMGWNEITPRPGNPLLADLPTPMSFYFVHSYYAAEVRDSDVAATADYGGTFCASVRHGNIFATQFHPEKSQRVGLKLLENFHRL